ncbi:ferritin heavy polypeptide-like 17 [Muntiacus reevesi]|uniref:ferritin heavy polypeptide-like 17 n=1 Tax=Muntiacus reevesi TaxID=9886 RepID=UPI003306C944
MSSAVASQARRCYHHECNSHTALELRASFQCLARACSLHHHNVALQRFSRVFLLFSQEHSETTESLMLLQNWRGGSFSFLDMRNLEIQDWESGLQGMPEALHLEKSVNQSLFDMRQLAIDSSDAHRCHWTSRSSSSRSWETKSTT